MKSIMNTVLLDGARPCAEQTLKAMRATATSLTRSIAGGDCLTPRVDRCSRLSVFEYGECDASAVQLLEG